MIEELTVERAPPTQFSLIEKPTYEPAQVQQINWKALSDECVSH